MDNRVNELEADESAYALASRLRQMAEKVAELGAKADLEEAADEIEQLNSLFDLRWEADMRAITMWNKGRPGEPPTWPDHVDLVVWLMAQLDGMRAAMENRDGA